MPDPYTPSGKQILHEGRHFADMASPESAASVAAILNAYVEASPLTFAEAERVVLRFLDHMALLCLRHDFGRDDPVWADVVQTVHRFSRDEIARREGGAA